MLGNKHIPAVYLRSSRNQRRALLAGLLDSDGTVTPTGSVQFSVTSRRLAEDVRELVVSLGYRCGWSQKRVRGASAESSVAYTITFTTTDDVFRLERKRVIHREAQAREDDAANPAAFHHRCATRRERARPVRAGGQRRSPVPGQSVHDPDPQFDAGPGLRAGRRHQARHDRRVLFSLEMGRNEITMRLLSAEARVPLSTMRTGQMNDDDWARLARRMSEVADAPLFIDDSPNMSMMEIRAKCPRLKQRNDLKIVIVDYLS